MQIIRRAILAIALIAGLAPVMAQVPPPVPALPDTERRTTYQITASTCTCNVNFALYGDSTDYQDWLEVWINGVQIQFNDPAQGWTITSPTGPLGNIARPITDAVLTFAQSQTGTIQIVGARRPRRTSQFQENNGVPTRNFNVVLSDIIAMLREAWDKINDVTGRGVFAPPGETMATLPPAASRANMGASFDSNGNLVPSVAVPSGSFNAGAGITFTGAGPTTISTATFAPGTGVAFTGSNPTVISVLPNSTAIVQSRAIAQTLNLSAFAAVQTLGYATPGDGGGAIFKVTTAPFIDTTVNGFTLAGGSGYANGQYNIPLGGGVGVGCQGQAQVSTGGVVTSVSIDTPCPGYAVGNVLSSPGCCGGGTGFSITITSVTAPGASFTDAVGTKFQYVTDQSAYPNVKQFGAKMDYNGVDATATNDMAAFQSAMDFAFFPYTASAAAVNGTKVMIPKGASLLCGGTFVIPEGITLIGAGSGGGTKLKQCTSEGANTHFIQLCSLFTTRGQFGCAIKDMNITMDGPANMNIAAIHSVAGQQFPLLDNVLIAPGLRSCILYEQGLGGASNAEFLNGDCESDGASTNDAIVITNTVQSTQVIFHNWVVECGGCTNNKTGFAVSGGFFIADNIQFEQVAKGFIINTPFPSSIAHVADQATTACSFVVQVTPVNGGGTTTVQDINPDTCPITFNNARSGGTNVNGYIGLPIAP